MARDHARCADLNRRRWLELGVTSLFAAWLRDTRMSAQSAPPSCAPPIPQNHEPSNGGQCPYPIPWLDQNGNHNQAAMPNVDRAKWRWLKSYFPCESVSCTEKVKLRVLTRFSEFGADAPYRSHSSKPVPWSVFSSRYFTITGV